jgi:hypothetical protein
MGQNQPHQDQEFQEEYQYVKKDVKKVVFTNLLIIALLVGLFYANKQTGWLEKLFSRFF